MGNELEKLKEDIKKDVLEYATENVIGKGIVIGHANYITNKAIDKAYALGQTDMGKVRIELKRAEEEKAKMLEEIDELRDELMEYDSKVIRLESDNHDKDCKLKLKTHRIEALINKQKEC